MKFLLEKLEKFKEFPFELVLVSGKPINIDKNQYKFPVLVKTAINAKEMVNILMENDIYINTSSREGFCLCLAEAMAMGMPTIALNSIGNRGYMTGENAVFIEDNNIFLAGLAKLKDYDLRKRLNSEAKNSMRSYNLEEMIKNFKKILSI